MTGLDGVGYEPPCLELIDAVVLLVRHVTVATISAANGAATALPALRLQAWLPPTPISIAMPHQRLPGVARLGPCGSAPFQSLMQRLYRFVRRGCMMWPTDNQQLHPLLTLWLAVVAPWRRAKALNHLHSLASSTQAHSSSPLGLVQQMTHVSDMLHLMGGAQSSSLDDKLEGEFTADWQAHVLSCLPFYGLLMPMLVDRCADRIAATQDEATLKNLAAVLGVLKDSPALVLLLRGIESEYSTYLASRGRGSQHTRGVLEGQYAEVLPWLYEQLVTWEVAATANYAGDTSVTQATPQLLLFGVSPDSLAYKVREALTEAGKAFKPEVVAPLEELAQQLLPMDRLPATATAAEAVPHARQQASVKGIRRCTWQQVHLKGDPMRAPITTYEVAGLARFFVNISDLLNQYFMLGPYIDPDTEAVPEHVFQSFLSWVRHKKQWTVNLRFLADWRNLIAAVVLCMLAYSTVAFIIGFVRLARYIASIEID